MTNDLHSFLKDQEKEITNAIEGKTLIDYINRNAEEYGNYPALNTPANNEYSAWDSMSWSELRDEVKKLGFWDDRSWIKRRGHGFHHV